MTANAEAMATTRNKIARTPTNSTESPVIQVNASEVFGAEQDEGFSMDVDTLGKMSDFPPMEEAPVTVDPDATPIKSLASPAPKTAMASPVAGIRSSPKNIAKKSQSPARTPTARKPGPPQPSPDAKGKVQSLHSRLSQLANPRSALPARAGEKPTQTPTTKNTLGNRLARTKDTPPSAKASIVRPRSSVGVTSNPKHKTTTAAATAGQKNTTRPVSASPKRSAPIVSTASTKNSSVIAPKATKKPTPASPKGTTSATAASPVASGSAAILAKMNSLKVKPIEIPVDAKLPVTKGPLQEVANVNSPPQMKSSLAKKPLSPAQRITADREHRKEPTALARSLSLDEGKVKKKALEEEEEEIGGKSVEMEHMVDKRTQRKAHFLYLCSVF